MTDQDDVIEISYIPDEKKIGNEIPKKEEKLKKVPARKKPTSPAAKKYQKKIREQVELLKKVIIERNEYKDKYLRSLAEVDNFRKRIKKEKEEFQKYVLGDFILNFLEVVDNLERALKVKVPSEKRESPLKNEKSIISGIEMIYKQLLDILKKNNVEEIDSLGKVFDPNIHQALSKEERDGIIDPVILEVYQKGFMYNNKLLRPTLAKVAVPIEKVVESGRELHQEETDDEE